MSNFRFNTIGLLTQNNMGDNATATLLTLQ